MAAASPIGPRGRQRALTCALLAGLVLPGAAPSNAAAQFGNLKKKAAQAVLCGGGAYAGFKIGGKLAEGEIRKLGVAGAEAEKIRKGFQIGTAIVLCGAGAMLAGTVYDKLSERDLQARQREMDAALADAEPSSRTYVLPESQLEGTLTTEAPVAEGDKECRVVVDHLADAEGGEPVMTKFCRKPPNGKYELEPF